ncbi:MAG TPA: hypothetical protein VFH78_02160 [Candidatus Thermoplasmatota archaeon]|nr:hypothetical protein [Candidatus Thermoplasmatota archaeon]
MLGPAPPALLASGPFDAMDRPRKPRSTGGPEGPWWRRPLRPE